MRESDRSHWLISYVMLLCQDKFVDGSLPLPPSLIFKDLTDAFANRKQILVSIPGSDQRQSNRHSIIAFEAWYIDDWSVQGL